MFFTPKFQEFMETEKNHYTQLLEYLKHSLIDNDKLDFTYNSIFQLFCHISILHNTQTELLQTLMKMFGSLVEQQSINELQFKTKFSQPNFLDIFEEKNQQIIPNQKLIQDSKNHIQLNLQTINQTDNNNISNYQNEQQPKDKLFRQAVRTKKERQTLEGFSCKECAKFYEILPENEKRDQIVQYCSRHRANSKIIQEKLLLTPE